MWTSRFLSVVLSCTSWCLFTATVQSCCTSDADCTALANDAQMEYLDLYQKALVCDPACPGAVNCNMFGLCAGCRGCFITCEGAMKYIDDTAAHEDTVTFCPDGEVDDMQECYADSSLSGNGSASGAGSMTGGGGSGRGSASGDGSMTVGGGGGNGTASGSGSASSGGSIGTGSGSGFGSGSASGTLSGNGTAMDSGTGSASGSGGTAGNGTGSASGSGSIDGGASGTGSAGGSGSMSGGSGTGSAGGSGSMSGGSGTGSAGGSGSMSGGSGTGSAGGSGSVDVPGCTCEDAELERDEADVFCEINKSFYCDAECLPDSDPLDRLFQDMGGLWCKPFDWEGCRLCHMDCDSFEDGYCVPCPDRARDWCQV